jgi:hypothetical protein
MQKANVTIEVNPSDISFLKRRTGTSSRTGTLDADTQKIFNDAIALYKAIVCLAMEGEKLGTYTEKDGKVQTMTPLDLRKNQLAYALETADIPDLSRKTVEASFQRFVEDQRRHALKGNDGRERKQALSAPVVRTKIRP